MGEEDKPLKEIRVLWINISLSLSLVKDPECTDAGETYGDDTRS